jgi:hypothetical protein
VYVGLCQLGFGASTVWKRRDVTKLTSLTEQFINKGFVNTEYLGDFALVVNTLFNSVNDSLPKI